MGTTWFVKLKTWKLLVKWEEGRSLGERERQRKSFSRAFSLLVPMAEKCKPSRLAVDRNGMLLLLSSKPFSNFSWIFELFTVRDLFIYVFRLKLGFDLFSNDFNLQETQVQSRNGLHCWMMFGFVSWAVNFDIHCDWYYCLDLFLRISALLNFGFLL